MELMESLWVIEFPDVQQNKYSKQTKVERDCGVWQCLCSFIHNKLHGNWVYSNTACVCLYLLHFIHMCLADSCWWRTCSLKMGRWFLPLNTSRLGRAPVWSWPTMRRRWQRRSRQVICWLIFFKLVFGFQCHFIYTITFSCCSKEASVKYCLFFVFLTEHLEGNPQQRPSHWGDHRLLQVWSCLHGCGQVREEASAVTCTSIHQQVVSFRAVV